MKQKALLLLGAVLLTLACLGAPQSTALPTSNAVVTPESVSSATPQATALPEPLGKLKIAYILDGNVWFWSEATSARQLTSEGDALSAKISSDGLLIAYIRSVTTTENSSANESGESLWIVNTDGSSPREIMNVKEYAASLLLANRIDYVFSNFYIFAFPPNSSWIYFSTSQYTGDHYLPSNDLYFANSNFGENNPLLYKGKGGQFTFSPNGNYLAISSSSNIKVMQRDGSGLVTALHYPTISLETGYIPPIVWMENETGFYTVVPDELGINSKYLFVSADGNISAQLAEFESDLSIPVISPDGLKVAYVKRTANADELHVIEASTTDTIIASYEGAPLLIPWGWSPDSKRVVFSNAHPMLLLTAGIGIPPSPLTEAISPYSLRWIDAEHFIFFREGNLLIGQINNPETILIASGFSNQADTKEYDFVVSP